MVSFCCANLTCACEYVARLLAPGGQDMTAEWPNLTASFELAWQSWQQVPVYFGWSTESSVMTRHKDASRPAASGKGHISDGQMQLHELI